ncbi:MAG: DNA recombination protein RmuC [Phycisphaerae bacterium]|nr:DNA recombination protein RmuC [Phycisphaerae bacterium]
MDVVHVILGVVGLGGFGAAAWLAARLSRTGAVAASARADADHATTELARARDEASKASARIEDLTERNTGLTLSLARLENQARAAADLHEAELAREREVLAERIRGVERRERELKEHLEKAESTLRDAFKSLSVETLKESSDRFLQLAKEHLGAQQKEGEAQLEQRRAAVEQLVKPIAETLQKTDVRLGQIEKSWAEDKGRLAESLTQVGQAQQTLRTETARLVKALREPNVRGYYGEIQLRKVAELAGMREYCDFAEQDSTRDGEGNLLRPDMVVRLPSARELAVDAKANLKPYLDALEADTPEGREGALRAFADGVADQASRLARKAYWKQYDRSPEFVVMFMPGDQFVDAALSKRPDLLETAAAQRVLLASPSTLIALLHAVHLGYKEQRLADEARQLQRLGAELLERFGVALEHVAQLGKALDKAGESYNKFVGSYQSRLEPTLRRFEEGGVRAARDLPEVPTVTTRPRPMGELPAGGGLAGP